MNYFIVICGAVGAWLLVAGPVYQAALELEEQEVDREGIDAAVSTVKAPARLSPWWWLLPPVALVLQRRQSTAHRRAVMEALGPVQLEQSVRFLNKASGWLIVAAGAFLIAIHETWELADLLRWPSAVFWILVVVLPVLCIGNAALTITRTNSMLKRDEKESAEKGAQAG